MKSCAICYIEKDAAEFTNMALHGCTCTDTHFCAACILHWLGTRARLGALSLADWRCPHCQNRAPPPNSLPAAAETTEIQLIPAAATDTDGASALAAMHQRWREQCPTYPAMTTMSEVFALPDDRYSMSVDVVLHRGTYYFCFAIDQLPRCSLGYRCDALPGDDLLAVVMTTINERYRRFALLMDAIDRHAGNAEARAGLLGTRNILKLGSVLEAAPRAIHRNVRHWNDDYEKIARCFVHYIRRVNPGVGASVLSDFVSDYFRTNESRENPLYYSLGDPDDD